MKDRLEIAIERIRAIGNEYCERQMYYWPAFDPMDPDPDAFFEREGIEYDGGLFIRFPVKRTFSPLTPAQVRQQESELGVRLPRDYVTLLETFGEFQLPGNADVGLDSPRSAQKWSSEHPPPVLAISPYNNTGDGNSLGFIRDGDRFLDAVYEFEHELVWPDAEVSTWTTKIADSLADFVIEYLDRPRQRE